MPTFSIIIPCYKVEKYIRECLDSVLAQSETSWEAICVDDGSPDNTGKILDEYASKDRRIKVIHQPNAGLSAARNAALAVATGDWLLYLDSDDMLSPWALRAYSRCIEKCPDADMLDGGWVRFFDGTKVNWREETKNIQIVDLSKRLTKFGHDGTFQQLVCKRSVLGLIPWSGESYCEERPYGAKCMAIAKKAASTDCICYGYRVRKGSITSKKMTLSQCMGYLDATRIVLSTYKASGKEIDGYLIRMFLTNWLEWQPRLIHNDLSKSDRKIAWKHYFETMSEALQYQPMSLWRRFTIVMCKMFPFRVVAMGLCYFPDWLKRKGLHR